MPRVVERLSRCAGFLFLCAFLETSGATAAEVTEADLLLTNGNIYTGNDAQPHADAVAIRGERIVFVGTDEEAKKLAGEKTKTIDLHGETVLPGLTDSHYHILGVGERLIHLNLEGTKSRAVFLDTVKATIAETAAGKWVTGRGWIETFWQPPTFPTRPELDEIAPDNPVFLVRADGHGAVANSEALKIAGIDRQTKNPFGGEIVRDPKTGEATGMLLDNAMDLVEKKIPPPTAEETKKAFLLGAKRSLSLRLVRNPKRGSYLPEVAMMRKLSAARKVKLRIYNAVYGPGEPAAVAPEERPDPQRLRSSFHHAHDQGHFRWFVRLAQRRTAQALRRRARDFRFSHAKGIRAAADVCGSVAPRHPGRDPRDRRSRESHHSRSLRRSLPESSA